jgi:hypothetical protein
MKMEQTEFSKTSAYKIQMVGNYPEENIQHTEHGESLKSRIILMFMDPCIVDDSVETPTRCSFVIEFIIPKLLKAQHVSSGTPLIIRSSKLYLQPLVYIPMS